MPYGTYRLYDAPLVDTKFTSRFIGYADYTDNYELSTSHKRIIRSGSNVNAGFFKKKRVAATYVYKVVPFSFKLKLKRRKNESDASYESRCLVNTTRIRRVRVATKFPKYGFQLPPNSLTSTRWNFTSKPATITGTHPDGRTRSITGMVAFHDTCPTWGSNQTSAYQPGSYGGYDWCQSEIDILNARALSSLREKIKNQNIDLATFLAQGKQTMQSIMDTAKKLAKALILAKKGRIGPALRELGLSSVPGVSSNYLLLEYGFKPLISDITGILKTLSDSLAEAKAVDVIASKSGYSERTLSKIYSKPIRAKNTVEQRVRYTVKYKVQYSVSQDVLRGLDQLGFLTPASVAWELIPYSFIIDWFLPVGDWLNNQGDFLGIKIDSITKTTFVEVVSNGTVEPWYGDPEGYLWFGDKARWDQQYVYVTRQVLDSIPEQPAPIFRNQPRLDISLALLTSRLKGR